MLCIMIITWKQCQCLVKEMVYSVMKYYITVAWFWKKMLMVKEDSDCNSENSKLYDYIHTGPNFIMKMKGHNEK